MSLPLQFHTVHIFLMIIIFIISFIPTWAIKIELIPTIYHIKFLFSLNPYLINVLHKILYHISIFQNLLAIIIQKKYYYKLYQNIMLLRIINSYFILNPTKFIFYFKSYTLNKQHHRFWVIGQNVLMASPIRWMIYHNYGTHSIQSPHPK